jgi:phytol kinase
LALLGERIMGEVLPNVWLTLLCYGYVLLIILVSTRIDAFLRISGKASRKFLHIMIGNLPFVIPFFTMSLFPVLVAAPFVVVTLLAVPSSPLSKKLKGLAVITEEGHRFGLVFYAFSYTLLAAFFPFRPYVVAVGVLTMAYGDAAASIVGQRYGKNKYHIFAWKSLEGSIAMFVINLLALLGSLAFFSAFYPIQVLSKTGVILGVSGVAALVEGLSPLGFDNLTVPFSSITTFLLLGGGA